MQEYVEEQTIAISVKAAKLSGKVLAAACKKVFSEIAKQQEAAKRPKGRQSVRKLNRVGGGFRRRPLTPPDMRFRIRRFS